MKRDLNEFGVKFGLRGEKKPPSDNTPTVVAVPEASVIITRETVNPTGNKR